jgi:hypothetical protein
MIDQTARFAAAADVEHNAGSYHASFPDPMGRADANHAGRPAGSAFLRRKREIVLFDRSWVQSAGVVEKVFDFAPRLNGRGSSNRSGPVRASAWLPRAVVLVKLWLTAWGARATQSDVGARGHPLKNGS